MLVLCVECHACEPSTPSRFWRWAPSWGPFSSTLASRAAPSQQPAGSVMASSRQCVGCALCWLLSWSGAGGPGHAQRGAGPRHARAALRAAEHRVPQLPAGARAPRLGPLPTWLSLLAWFPPERLQAPASLAEPRLAAVACSTRSFGPLPVSQRAAQGSAYWEVAAGYVGALTAEIPLTSLGSTPVSLAVEEVLITVRPRARAPDVPAADAGGGGGGGGGAQEGGGAGQAPSGALESPPGPDLEALGQAAVVDGVRLIAGGIEDMLQRLRVQARTPARGGRCGRPGRQCCCPI